MTLQLLDGQLARISVDSIAICFLPLTLRSPKFSLGGKGCAFIAVKNSNEQSSRTMNRQDRRAEGRNVNSCRLISTDS